MAIVRPWKWHHKYDKKGGRFDIPSRFLRFEYRRSDMYEIEGVNRTVLIALEILRLNRGLEY